MIMYVVWEPPIIILILLFFFEFLVVASTEIKRQWKLQLSKLSRFLRRSLVSNSVPFLHFRYGSLKRCRSKLRRVKKLYNTSLHMQLRSGGSPKV